MLPLSLSGRRTRPATAWPKAELEAGKVWQKGNDASLDDLLWSGSLYVGLDTHFGPVFVAYGRGEGCRDTWYLF